MRLIDAEALAEWFRPYLHEDERIDPDVVIHDIRTFPSAAPPANAPLTLEELREMDGEPICVAPVDGGPYVWMLVDTRYEVCREAHGGLAIFENLGKTWLAYRRRPEKGE